MKEAPGGQGGPQNRHEEGNQDGKGGPGRRARTSQLPRPTTHRHDNKPHASSASTHMSCNPICFNLSAFP